MAKMTAKELKKLLKVYKIRVKNFRKEALASEDGIDDEEQETLDFLDEQITGIQFKLHARKNKKNHHKRDKTREEQKIDEEVLDENGELSGFDFSDGKEKDPQDDIVIPTGSPKSKVIKKNQFTQDLLSKVDDGAKKQAQEDKQVADSVRNKPLKDGINEVRKKADEDAAKTAEEVAKNGNRGSLKPKLEAGVGFELTEKEIIFNATAAVGAAYEIQTQQLPLIVPGITFQLGFKIGFQIETSLKAAVAIPGPPKSLKSADITKAFQDAKKDQSLRLTGDITPSLTGSVSAVITGAQLVSLTIEGSATAALSASVSKEWSKESYLFGNVSGGISAGVTMTLGPSSAAATVLGNISKTLLQSLQMPPIQLGGPFEFVKVSSNTPTMGAPSVLFQNVTFKEGDGVTKLRNKFAAYYKEIKRFIDCPSGVIIEVVGNAAIEVYKWLDSLNDEPEDFIFQCLQNFEDAYLGGRARRVEAARIKADSQYMKILAAAMKHISRQKKVIKDLEHLKGDEARYNYLVGLIEQDGVIDELKRALKRGHAKSKSEIQKHVDNFESNIQITIEPKTEEEVELDLGEDMDLIVTVVSEKTFTNAKIEIYFTCNGKQVGNKTPITNASIEGKNTYDLSIPLPNGDYPTSEEAEWEICADFNPKGKILDKVARLPITVSPNSEDSVPSNLINDATGDDTIGSFSMFVLTDKDNYSYTDTDKSIVSTLYVESHIDITLVDLKVCLLRDGKKVETVSRGAITVKKGSRTEIKFPDLGIPNKVKGISWVPDKYYNPSVDWSVHAEFTFIEAQNATFKELQRYASKKIKINYK